MIKIWSFLIILFLSTSLYSQQGQDLEQLIAIGKGHFDNAQYDSALIIFIKAREVSQRENAGPRDLLRITNELSETYLEMGNFREAAQNLRKFMPLQKEENEALAKSYDILGDISFKTAKYTEAQEQYEKALQIKKKIYPNDNLDIADSYNNIGKIYYIKSEPVRSVEYIERSLKIRLEFLPPDDAEVGGSYNNLAILYGSLGDLNKSIEYHNKSLQIKIAQLGASHPKVAVTYNNMANMYFNMNELARAKEYHQKAYDIRVAHYGPEHHLVSKAYMGFGDCFFKQGIYDKSRQYYEKALKINRNSIGEVHPHNAQLYSHTGACYFKEGDHEEAVKYYKKAQEIYRQTLGEFHPDATAFYSNMARAYQVLGEYDSAFKYIRKSYTAKKALSIQPGMGEEYLVMGNIFHAMHSDSAEIYYKKAIHAVRQADGDNTLDLVEPYRSLGAYYEDRKQFNAAEDAFQKGFKLFGLNRNLVLDKDYMEGYEHKIKLLGLLYAYGSMKYAKFEHTQDLRALHEAIPVYKAAEYLIDLAVKSFHQENSELSLPGMAENIFSDHLRVVSRLYAITGNEYYFQKAFNIAERNRSISLVFELRESEARKLSGVHHQWLEEEGRVIINISEAEKNIQAAIAKQDSAASEEWKNKKFELQRDQDELLKKLSEKYPDYFRAKYKIEPLSISKVKAGLKEDEAIIEYCLTRDALYIFYISKEKNLLHQVRTDKALVQNILDFREATAVVPTSLEQQNEFHRKNTALFRKLISPVAKNISSDIASLIIIPDGILGYIPFEVLRESPRDPYLLEKYAVSYAYSTQVLQLLKNDRNIRKAKYSFAGFAPEYAQNSKVDSGLDEDDYSRFRSVIVPLPMAAREVNTIADLMSGRAWVGGATTEKVFLENAPDYSILHLSAHGVNDNTDPLFSGLIFNNNDTIHDGFLQALEIYNLKLNADMVVLSACNTGYGTIRNGEGIMSLSRAFAYAGCPSTVMSLWQVSDRAASEIMISFYKYLKKGHKKDQALRMAKLDYLSSSNDELLRHPFYWATFVPIGDMQPLDIKGASTTQRLLYILGIICLLSLSTIAVRRFLF